MTILHRISAFAVCVMLAACNDQTGLQVDDSPAFARKSLRTTSETVSSADAGATADAGTIICTSAAEPTDVPPCTLRHRPDAPPLESYNPSFRILAGYQYHLNVFYSPDPVTGVREYFLTVTIPRDAEFFDESGNSISRGQPVVVTMDIDPDYFHVEFGPHGTQFTEKRPAIVRFSLVNALIEGTTSNLEVSYRPNPTEPQWTTLPTTFDARGWWVEGPVYHFSGYAVAW